MNLVNRVALLKRSYFMDCVSSLEVSPDIFLDAWFAKMDYLVSIEAKRLNLIAIYTLFPTFP